ncbi:MAG: orotidine-5'-phosphate decarboxylase [Bdellovibrionota bacterium]
MSKTPQKKEIAVALDTSTREEFLKIYHSLETLDLVFKIGLKILPRLELSDWKTFQNKKIFVDAKLHDIPTQVADAVSAYGDQGASYITVHLSGGRKMLEEAQKKAERYKLTLLGVSALTSLSDADLRDIGFNDGSQRTVERLVQLGLDAGLNSFVMSPWELNLKTQFSQIYCVTPGISLEAGKSAPDQARTASLKEALEMGSDMPVIGRAIVQNPNPKNAASNALQMLNI